MKFPVVESTMEYETFDYLVRLWFDEGEEIPNEHNTKALWAQQYYMGMKEILEAHAQQEGINAVQVINKQTRRGIVVYINWP